MGNELWDKSQDIKFAMVKQWDEIKHINKSYLENLSESKLKILRNQYIFKSYQYYRTVCKVADEKRLIIFKRNNFSIIVRSR